MIVIFITPGRHRILIAQVFELELCKGSIDALHKHDTLWGMVSVRRAVRHPKLSRCTLHIGKPVAAETPCCRLVIKVVAGLQLQNAPMFPTTSPGCIIVSYLLLRYCYLESGYPQMAIALSLWTSRPATLQ